MGPAVLRERTGASIATLTRSELHATLLCALPDGTVHLGTEAIAVPNADLVVAADGIDSSLRRILWPELPLPVSNGEYLARYLADPQQGARATVQ